MSSAARWLGATVLLAAYVAAGKFGLALAVVNASASAVWLPTGIAIAGILVGGRRLWPAIAIGAFVVNATTAGTILTSLAIAVGNTLEAVIGARLIECFAGGRAVFERPATVFRFVPFVFAAAVASATIGVATLLVAGLTDLVHAPLVWLTWWLGDGIGAVIACPLIVLWANEPLPRLSPGRWLEVATVTAVTVVVAAAIFGGLVVGGGISAPMVFICLPPILWAGMRFSQRETATISLLLMAIALRGSLIGKGPFAHVAPEESLLLLQAFIAITTVTGMVVASAVSERRRLESELALRARDLARSNQELEQFAYITAHDLQEPARMIISYLQLIERRAPQLDGATREHFAVVTASAARMQGMIRAILDYSRIGKDDAGMAEVDVGAALAQALETLRDAVRESGAAIEAGALPRVNGNPTQLSRLFQNLIANALKFRAPERPPTIRVGAERTGTAWEFTVADNGIGIDAAHRERLFGLFQRLHTGDRYPGHGIGLASCKKIVEQHGGRIWFDSVPGEGTTFRFTIPDHRDLGRR